MKKLITSVSLMALLLTCAASPAAAQVPPGGVGGPGAGAPVAPAKAGRDKGLMLRLGFGVDGCTDTWCDHVDPMVNLRVVALYRIMKYVAAGLHMAFLFGDPDNNFADRVWNLFIGAEGRGIFPYKQFDFWVALSLGYNRTMGALEVCGFGVCVDGQSWSNAFALGFGFGADYYLTKNIALGLSFYLYKPWPDEYCEDSNRTNKVCNELSQNDLDDIGIIWSINAVFTYFLPM
jgi:opacity protein-like surface antigen